MVKICYILAVLCELVMGIAIINKVYPEFRYKSNIVKVLAGILFFVGGAIYVWNACLFFISTSCCLAVGVVLSILYKIFWHANFWKVLLLQLFYYINILILKVPILTMRGIKSHKNVLQVNRGARTVTEVTYIFLILLLIYIFLKYFKNVEVFLRKLFLENTILCTVTLILEWLMLCFCMRNGKFEFEKVDFVLNLVSIFSVAIFMFSMALLLTYQQVKYEKLLQNEMYECLKSQYCEMKELYEFNSRWVHDVKHELLVVGSCLGENNLEKAYEKIQGYLQKIEKTERKVWSGFAFLDFMINYKKMEMDKQNIKFMLDVDLQHIEIPEDDLVIIIGNLLDNAIEATSSCEQSKRRINLKICNVNDMLLVCIENDSDRIPQLKNNHFITRKQNMDLHGWGIESVKRLVESYNGGINFEYSQDYFRVQILL